MTSEQEQELKTLKSISFRELAIIFTLMLNFGGVIWGAATLNAAVSDLENTVHRINASIAELSRDLMKLNIEHTERIRALEAITEHNGAQK